MTKILLTRKNETCEEFHGDVDGELPSGWYLATLRIRPAPGQWVARAGFTPSDGMLDPQEFLLVRPFGNHRGGLKTAVFFMLSPPRRCTVHLMGVTASPDRLSLVLTPLPRLAAITGVWLQSPGWFRAALAQTPGPWRQRLRTAVATTASHGQEVAHTYQNWCTLFDTWPDRRLAAFAAALPVRASIAVLVFTTRAASPALAATLASLHNQLDPAARILIASPDAPPDPVALAAEHDWIALVQAGEVLPPHALLMLAQAVQRPDAPDIVYADEDRLSAAGTRSDPMFKPQPSLTFMCSGLLSRGVWLVRSHLLQPGAAWAECARLAAWFALHAARPTARPTARHAASARRLPLVLTHARPDTERAPAPELARLIDARLSAAGVQATVSPEFPLRLQWHGTDTPAAKVSIIIPSRLKGDVQLACIADLLANTDYGNFEVFIVVTQDTPLDAEQAQSAQRLLTDSRVSVERLAAASFNYSTANNVSVQRTQGEFICLLNDDVSTLSPDWLTRMVAMFSEPDTAVVGAKLYYPDMTTQHGGVIMGLAGVAQHAHRFLPRGQPGYGWRGVLDQGISCVTGACLLTRRTIYNEVGGLDEGLPTGFNDVDFCMKVRRLGHGIVFAGSVELVHHETITFGHHYKNNPDQEFVDSALIRMRWPDLCQNDPYHNPNLGLTDTREWELAFPPRLPGAANG